MKTKDKIKYYHASPSRIKVGSYLRTGNGWMGDAVYMTTSPIPHYTIAEKAIKEGWHVYEVSPVGEVFFGSCWDEAFCDQAVIVKYVGNARGITSGKFIGSRVSARRFGSGGTSRDVIKGVNCKIRLSVV